VPVFQVYREDPIFDHQNYVDFTTAIGQCKLQVGERHPTAWQFSLQPIDTVYFTIVDASALVIDFQLAFLSSSNAAPAVRFALEERLPVAMIVSCM
jgi:hypothetical protein